MVYDSYGNGLRLKNIPGFDTVLVNTAKSLATRFRPAAGILQSWNTDNPAQWQAHRGWDCPVIIDNMMNLELLFKVTEMTGDDTYKSIAISHGTKEDHQSRIYTVSLEGGVPRLITPMAPSYLHGWSPDGKTLAYCAERNGNFDIYTIPVEGGEETRLTTAEDLDDGSEYDSVGEYIWFNSVRSGLMQAWRMKADGSEQTQMTFDEEWNTWFPHISPDRQKVVMLAYKKGDVEPNQHLPHKYVELRLMNADGSDVKTIVKLFGGQGTINVNSWAPDSKKFAFVRYRIRGQEV
jgi:Tol biopolymer transport system component